MTNRQRRALSRVIAAKTWVRPSGSDVTVFAELFRKGFFVRCQIETHYEYRTTTATRAAARLVGLLPGND